MTDNPSGLNPRAAGSFQAMRDPYMCRVHPDERNPCAKCAAGRDTPPPMPLDDAMLGTTVRLAAAQWGAPAVARAAARLLGDGVALLDLDFAGIPLYVDVVGAPATDGVALAACSLTVEFPDGKGVTVAGVALVVDDEPLYFHETEPMPDPDGAERILLAVHGPRLADWRTLGWSTIAAGLRRAGDPDPASALAEPADREDVRA